MTPTISIGELQKKTSYFRSQEPFFIRDKRKNKNISFVIPVDGMEENEEFLKEAKKLCKKYFLQKTKKRVFPTPFKNKKMTEKDWGKFWKADDELENELENNPIFPN